MWRDGSPIPKSEFVARVQAGHAGPGAADKLALGQLAVTPCLCASQLCQGWYLAPVEWKAVDLQGGA